VAATFGILCVENETEREATEIVRRADVERPGGDDEQAGVVVRAVPVFLATNQALRMFEHSALVRQSFDMFEPVLLER
jgi:hypothetical protein